MYHSKLTTPLTREEELEHALRYKKGDKRAGDRLIESNLRFVVKIASQYQSRYGGNLADYVQEGAIGLMRALPKFQPERGWRFISYAVHWVRVHIHNEVLRNVSLVKYGTTETQRRLFFDIPRALKEMTNSAGEEPSTEDLAREVNASVKDVESARTRLSGRDMSLNAPWKKHENEGAIWMDTLLDAAPGTDIAFEDAEAAALEASLLHQALCELTTRERTVIEMRHMRDPGATLKEIGDALGFSREYARQLEVKALRKIEDFVKSAA